MEAPISSPKILLVDDEASILKLAKFILTRAKYQVVTSENAEQALKQVENHLFDLIITDATMPGMSGFDLVQTLRAHPEHGQIPILMLTRKRERGDVKQAVEVGVTDYLVKPIDDALLLDKVELCLKKGKGMRHIFQAPVFDPDSKATLEIPCRVVSLSESEVNVQAPIQIKHDFPFELMNGVFAEMGIDVPLLKFIKCESISEPGRAPLFEIKLGFVGVPDNDLKKIRAWLQRQALRMRK